MISMLCWKVRLTIYPDFVVVRSPVVNAEYVTGHDLKMELIWNGSDVLWPFWVVYPCIQHQMQKTSKCNAGCRRFNRPEFWWSGEAAVHSHVPPSKKHATSFSDFGDFQSVDWSRYIHWGSTSRVSRSGSRPVACDTWHFLVLFTMHHSVGRINWHKMCLALRIQGSAKILVRFVLSQSRQAQRRDQWSVTMLKLKPPPTKL